MQICYIQHVPFEGPAALEDWANARGHDLKGIHIYKGDTLPDPGEYSLLVVLGGPMNIYDEKQYPWLADEKQYLARAIKSDKTVIGICLGAQLLADVLGAKVKPNIVKEIGWFPVSLTPLGWNDPIFKHMPATFEAFHWHGDTFELPPNAHHIATSYACPHQAYIWDGRVIGLQFHLETKPKSVELLLENCADEIEEDGECCQSPEEMMVSEERFAKLHEAFFTLMDNLPVVKSN